MNIPNGGNPRSVGDIANQLRLRQPQASKHLRVLSDAGLVEVQAIANFDRLDDYLQELQKMKRSMMKSDNSVEAYEQNSIGGIKAWTDPEHLPYLLYSIGSHEKSFLTKKYSLRLCTMVLTINSFIFG